MLRVVVLVDKSRPAGINANVAAILLGQMARTVPELYAAEPVEDGQGVRHAGIRYNVVVLAATRPVGIVLAGEDDCVRSITRKYSLYR